MPHSLKDLPARKSAEKVQMDAELFLLALRSYPEMFRQRPDVSFEQHFLSLVAATHSGLNRTYAVTNRL